MRTLKKALGAVIIGLATIVNAVADYTYSESFMNSTAAGWTAYQQGAGPGPRLTAGTTATTGDPETGIIDTTGNGWLRMTNTTQQQANSFVFNSPVAATNNTIKVNFEVAMWNKNANGAADGIAFFMYDANQAFAPGATGGSMGYAQKVQAQGGESNMQGIPGGYFAVGIDNWGNFSNPTEGRIGGQGFTPNSVTVRGAGSIINDIGSPLNGGWYGGYDYIAGTGGTNTTIGGNPAIAALTDQLDFPDNTVRPDTSGADYRGFEIVLDSSNNLTVKMKVGASGSYVTLFTANNIGVRPSDLRLGFTGGTGGSAQVLELRSFAITTVAGSNTWVWDNGAGISNKVWGAAGGPNNYQNNWDKNTNPTTVSGVTPDVVFDNQYVTANQTITVRDGDKNVSNIYLGGQYSYILNPADGTSGGSTLNPTIFLDNGTSSSPSVIGVYNNPSGNANHQINTKISALNNVIINHFVNQSLSFGRNFNINANNLTVNTVGTVTMTSLSGSGTITKQGTGSYILTSANTGYTGNVTIQDGTLKMQHAQALGSSGSGSITVQSGGTLELSSTGTVATKALTLNGTGFGGLGALRNTAGNNTWAGTISLPTTASVGVSSGTQLTVTGAISGAGGLTKEGTGTLVLRGNNTFTGITTVNAGTLTLNGSGSNKALASTTQVVINTGGTLLFAKANQINAAANMTLGGGTLNTAGFAQTLNTMTFSSNSTLILGGSALTLTDLVRTGGVLTVDNYTFDGQFKAAIGAVDQTTLNSIYFFDQGIMGAFQLANGYIVPAPEPSTYVLGLVIIASIFIHMYRTRLRHFFN